MRFEKEDHGFITWETWYYFIDDKTGTKLFLGSNSGDHSVSEDRAKMAYEEEKTKVLNAFETELNMIVLPSQKWKYFDSTLYPIPYAPEKTMQFVYSGPFGRGMSYG